MILNRKGYKAISKPSEGHNSIVRNIIHKWKTFKRVASFSGSGHLSKLTHAVFRETAKHEPYLILYMPQLAR